MNNNEISFCNIIKLYDVNQGNKERNGLRAYQANKKKSNKKSMIIKKKCGGGGDGED